MYTPYMTVYLVIPLQKLPYIHRIYMVLANLTMNAHMRMFLANPTRVVCYSASINVGQNHAYKCIYGAHAVM